MSTPEQAGTSICRMQNITVPTRLGMFFRRVNELGMCRCSPAAAGTYSFNLIAVYPPTSPRDEAAVPEGASMAAQYKREQISGCLVSTKDSSSTVQKEPLR
ncbi:hypothetical protein Bbelb_207940 [Branchiostoma belcheri]|nr:hypothetical protein Bbelb_207940 [Branchiostoma belcheri]